MRKIVILFIAAAMLLAGCSKSSDGVSTDASDQLQEQNKPFQGEGAPTHDTVVPVSKGNVVEISERLFIAQTNDVYINTEDYLGKTIKYEGIFKTTYWPETDKTYYFVIRYGPGCCGYDGEAGFEVSWDGQWPEEDAWCEAVGVLETYEANGMRYLRLALSSLTVLEERGAEFVST